MSVAYVAEARRLIGWRKGGPARRWRIIAGSSATARQMARSFPWVTSADQVKVRRYRRWHRLCKASPGGVGLL